MDNKNLPYPNIQEKVRRLNNKLEKHDYDEETEQQIKYKKSYEFAKKEAENAIEVNDYRTFRNRLEDAYMHLEVAQENYNPLIKITEKGKKYFEEKYEENNDK